MFIKTVVKLSHALPPNIYSLLGKLTYGFLLVIVASLHVRAQESFKLRSIAATISGNSSLHDWKSTINKTEFKGTLEYTGKLLSGIRNIEVKVPVKSIKSKEGRIMNKKTYEAFKADQNPFIIFTCNTAHVKTEANNTVSIEGTGHLSMAGVTKAISLTGTGKMLPNGDMQLSVAKTLDMTEYNMDPPKAVMGTIVVRDRVTVQFDMILIPAKLVAAANTK